MSATLVGQSSAREEATFLLQDGRLPFLLDEYRLTMRTNDVSLSEEMRRNWNEQFNRPIYTTWVGNFSLRLTHSDQLTHFRPAQTGQFRLRFEGGNVSTVPIYLESCNFQADLFPEEGIHFGRMRCDFISCGDMITTVDREIQESRSRFITDAVTRHIMYGEFPSPVGTASPASMSSRQHSLSERLREAEQRQQDRMDEMIEAYRSGSITANELRRNLGLPITPESNYRRTTYRPPVQEILSPGLTPAPVKPRKPLPSRRRIQLPAGGITLDEE